MYLCRPTANGNYKNSCLIPHLQPRSSSTRPELYYICYSTPVSTERSVWHLRLPRVDCESRVTTLLGGALTAWWPHTLQAASYSYRWSAVTPHTLQCIRTFCALTPQSTWLPHTPQGGLARCRATHHSAKRPHALQGRPLLRKAAQYCARPSHTQLGSHTLCYAAPPSSACSHTP